MGMREKFLRELVELGLASRPGEVTTVTESDLEALPPPAQRFLRFMRVPGRPRSWSFCARWEGRFRRAPDASWMPCEVWQYNSAVDVARIFHMRLRLGGVLPTYIRDLYVQGGGHMVGKVLDAFPVVDDASEKVTIGELVTYLNDALMFAPSMLLGPGTTWSAVDDGSFDVALEDRSTRVSGRVFVDERGALTDFSTTDRFGVDPDRKSDGLTRARWTTPVRDWAVVEGHLRPLGSCATWHFPGGDFRYAEIDGASLAIAFDVAPGVGL